MDLPSPVNAGDINDHVYHVTAELVGLHVHRRAVGGDVYLTDHVEQEGLLDPGMLQNTRGVQRAQIWKAGQRKTEQMSRRTEMKMFKRFSNVGN